MVRIVHFWRRGFVECCQRNAISVWPTETRDQGADISGIGNLLVYASLYEARQSAVLFQWKSHPEIHNPIKPDPSSIQVKTTQKVKIGSHKEKKKKARWNSKGGTDEYYEEEIVDDYEDRRRPVCDDRLGDSTLSALTLH
jgi:hypothetical protein